MLKKAGIVVATAAAGMLALSPLAFAGDASGSTWGPSQSHTWGDKDHGDKNNSQGDTTNTLISQEGNGGNAICAAAQSNTSGNAGDSGNALLGLLPILNGNNVSALNNANTLNCDNILNNNLNNNQVAVLGANSKG